MSLKGREGGIGCDWGFCIWEFPKIGGTLLGVPIIRTIVFWGLYWGPLILGNYHMLSNLGLSMEVRKLENQ